MGMNDMIPKKYMVDFFKMLESEKIRYLLISNIVGGLPDKFQSCKPIDIIVNLEDRDRFSVCMRKHGFLFRLPAEGRNAGWRFAYQLPEYQSWQSGGVRHVFWINACFKLMCKSLSPKFWIPLDDSIQQCAWSEKEWNEDIGCWQLGERTLFVYVITHCVFDERFFHASDIAEIEKRKHLFGDMKVRVLLQTVFFRFADTLVQLLRDEAYESIIQRYLTFTDY